MSAWGELDLRWTSDHAPTRFPRDPLAVAAVVLASVWLWWVGSVMGLVLGAVALHRAPSRPWPQASRRWARTAVMLGLIGIATFSLFVAPPLFRHISRNLDDSAARASLSDLASYLQNHKARAGVVDSEGGGVGAWTLPGGSDVEVVSPGSLSTGYKMVSAEVWDLWAKPLPSHGASVYAAVLSGTGTCFYLRVTTGSEYASEQLADRTCTADNARDISDWSATSGTASGDS